MKTKLLFPSLIAFASALTGSASHAALMYSGVQNVAIPFDLPAGLDGVYLRLSDGATSVTYPANWNTEPWINPFFGGVYVANSDYLRPVITGTDQIMNLSVGTVIGLGSNFVAGESGSTSHVGVAANQFQIGTPGLLGFAFKTNIAGPDYYGWLRMTVKNTAGQTGTIVDWAYESTAGISVMAGVNVVPEAGTAIFGLACAAVGLCRRRRAVRGR